MRLQLPALLFALFAVLPCSFAQTTPAGAENIRPLSTETSRVIGYVTESACDGKSQRIDVKTSKGTLHLRAPASGAMPFEDPKDVPAGFNSCKSLKGQRVSIEFAPDDSREGGTITRLKLLPAGEVGSGEGPIAAPIPKPVSSTAPVANAAEALIPDAQMTAEGRVTEVICAGNDLIVKISTDKRQFTLHTRNYTRLNFDDDRRSFEDRDFPACTDLKGRTASIEFIVVEGKAYDGEMRNVEIEH
jgi:hypothetical protein